jgi:hypothetical protein
VGRGAVRAARGRHAECGRNQCCREDHVFHRASSRGSSAQAMRPPTHHWPERHDDLLWGFLVRCPTLGEARDGLWPEWTGFWRTLLKKNATR